MKQIKKILYTLLFPKTFIVVICVPVAAALLIYTFGFYGEKGPIAYVSYIFSAYALAIFCLRLNSVVHRAKNLVNGIANRNQYITRYMTDTSFKTKITLSISLALNIGYAILKFVTGIFYSSAWFITLAVYYILLMFMRFLLLRHVGRNVSDMAAEWKRCRACGIALLFMNIILTGMVVLILKRNEGFEYAGYLIYAMALYDFYTITMAVINLIKSRKHNRPVLTAAKVINVTTALITILSLETAMLTQFGSDTDPAFRHNMIACTGGGISVIIIIMAAFMIVKAAKNLKESDFNNFET